MCIGTLWKYEENGSKYPKLYEKTRKLIQSFQLHISQQIRPYSMSSLSDGQVIPILLVFGHYSNLGKLDPSTPNNAQRQIKSNH